MKHYSKNYELTRWWNKRFWIINTITIVYVFIDFSIQKYLYPFLAEGFIIPIILLFLAIINLVYFTSIHIILLTQIKDVNINLLKKINFTIIFLVLLLLMANSIKQYTSLKKSSIDNEYMIEIRKAKS